MFRGSNPKMSIQRKSKAHANTQKIIGSDGKKKIADNSMRLNICNKRYDSHNQSIFCEDSVELMSQHHIILIYTIED